jgi:anti-sigma factor RsiW
MGNGKGLDRVPVAMIGPLRHHRMRHAVGAYLDGELQGEAGAEVAEHLSICWDCSILAETLRLIKQSLPGRRDRTAKLLSERRLRRFAEKLDTEPAPLRNTARARGASASPNKPKGVLR